MRIVIVGNGKWGRALGTLLSENKHQFDFWEIGSALPSDSILIMCVPTQVIREVLVKYGAGLSNIIYINGAKGIEKGTHKLPNQIASEILGENIDYFSLIGPSFAGEVEKQMPTLVNIGYLKKDHAEEVKKLFQTDYFRVRLTSGVEALELAGAFKNVYAIACGVTDGLGFETNTRVKLIMLAIEELNTLFKGLNVKSDKDALPGTIGDLILTCNSEESRNFSFGKALSQNKVDEALKIIGETVEGFATVESIPYFEKTAGVKLPLARFVYEVIGENNPQNVKDKFTKFVKNT